MHDRAGGHRGLPTAISALVGEGFGLQQPGPAAAATRTDKPFRPTPLEKVLRTRAFRRKAVLKFDQRPRKPSLRSRHHPTPAHPDTDEQLTAQFSFCTLNLDWPDARAYALQSDAKSAYDEWRDRTTPRDTAQIRFYLPD